MTDDLSLYLKICEALYRALDLDRRAYIILTCTTAGQVFGFSRAFLLLVNEKTAMLEGKMGVGPASHEEASRVWHQMAQENKSLDELLEEYDKIPDRESMPLYPLVRRFNVPLSKEDELVIQCLKDKRALKVTYAREDARVSEEFYKVLGAEEFACIPLITQDKAVGVILADNLYSCRPISDENVQSLTFVARVLGAAIEGARIHQKLLENQRKLRKMTEELRLSYVLASVGEMAAYLTHEIKNPLVAIGGLARSIYKNTDEPDALGSIKKQAKIIIDEIEQLEHLVNDTGYVFRLDKLVLEREDLNQVIEDTCELMEEELGQGGVKLARDLSPVPHLWIDRSRIKAVLVNLIHNAIESMPQGGELKIKSQRDEQFVKMETKDTGGGVPPDIKEKIFSPFVSTKPQGSGLGLSMVKHIVEQHGGRVGIESRENEGTSVFIYLPIRER